MMRLTALQCLRSAKKASKSKPFWSANCVSRLRYGQLCPQLDHSHLFSSLIREFNVTRLEPGLVGPAEPTPRGVKPLSDLDDQPAFRMLTPMIHLYPHDPSSKGRDPVGIVREALARALVFYYPLAGRLREGPDGSLSVDCTGEGVLFVEAEADVELAQLGDPPHPPFPWYKEFQCGVPLFGGIVNSPLLYFQVTRLKCGGFVLGYRFNHIMCDAAGLVQFLNSVAEMARGARVPSLTPIWRRQLFKSPTQMSQKPKVNPIPPHHQDTIIERSFIFGKSEVSGLVPAHVRATTFETLTACLWRAHAASLQLDDDEAVTFMCSVSARDETNRIVPAGYYGNTVTPGAVQACAAELIESPIEYAIGLVKKAKGEGLKAGMCRRAGVEAIPPHWFKNCFFLSDKRRLGFGDIDFGWGKAAYAGVAKIEGHKNMAFYSPVRDYKGENGILVMISLSAEVMERFETQVKNILSH